MSWVTILNNLSSGSFKDLTVIGFQSNCHYTCKTPIEVGSHILGKFQIIGRFLNLVPFWRVLFHFCVEMLMTLLALMQIFIGANSHCKSVGKTDSCRGLETAAPDEISSLQAWPLTKAHKNACCNN